jgi:hypothetical protein
MFLFFITFILIVKVVDIDLRHDFLEVVLNHCFFNCLVQIIIRKKNHITCWWNEDLKLLES